MKSTLCLCALTLTAAALLTCGGCANDPTTGYTTTRQFPTDVETVAVPIWVRGKDVYRRDIEMQITEALVKRVQQNTPYRIADRATADTELTGELVKINQQVLHYNPDTGVARELEIQFTVNFTWKDLRTGKILVSKKGFIVSGTYIYEGPFNEDFYQGSEGVINKLARMVVEQMEADW